MCKHILIDNFSHTVPTFETTTTFLPTLLLFETGLGDVPTYETLADNINEI